MEERMNGITGIGFDGVDAAFTERIRINQRKLASELKSHYDFIVCGSGSSGSVVARRLAENPEVSVLLLEAGGSDDVPSVIEADQWHQNLGSERDWGFEDQPNPHLNGRSIPLSMGKVLGGGSSINVMAWARGHRNDWEFFAREADDPAWSYESVLHIYRRIEDWNGARDPPASRNRRAGVCPTCARSEPDSACHGGGGTVSGNSNF
jgi:choline dehydrogenase